MEKYKVESNIPVPQKEGFTNIYVLECPIDSAVKYVGQSINLEERYKCHLLGQSKLMRTWVASLKVQSKQPIMRQIEIVESIEADEREMYWIEFYENKFPGLLNKRWNKARNIKRDFPIIYLNEKG